jgi:phosphatidylglycerophosphatase B
VINPKHAAETKSALKRLVLPLAVTYLLIPFSFLIPIVDSTTEPYFDLTSGFARLAYATAESGGRYGAPIVGILMLLMLVSRPGITGVRRLAESLLVLVVVGIFAGGGAALNEHGIKTAFKVPRPNIVFLAGADGSGPLGMTAEQFYEIGDKKARRAPLEKALTANPAPIELDASIRNHWIHETGYAFPSGHAFSAMLFAMFFLAIGVTHISTRRIGLFYLLLPWALAVCYSRLILRVHTPADISVGGLEGLVVGLIAFWIVRIGTKLFDR